MKFIATNCTELGSGYYDLLNYSENTNTNNIISTISLNRIRKSGNYVYADLVYSNFATSRTFNKTYIIIEYTKK